MASSREPTITIHATLHEQKPGEKLPAVRVYAFDDGDNYITSEPYAGKPVELPAGDRPLRVVVGPDLLKDEKPPSNLRALLAKAGGVTADYFPTLSARRLSIPISRYVWFCWWETCIVVHGTVRKLLNPGASPPLYAPICTGTVQIFQVDLGCTLDTVISFGLPVFRERLVARLTGGLATGSIGAVFKTSAPGFTASKIAALRVPAVKTTHRSRAASPVNSLAEIASSLAVLEKALFKDFVLQNSAVLWPFWCELIPDDWFCWQELGPAAIQSDGTFTAEVCFWCPDDYPDLYFEVVQNINGTDNEIYDPRIACSTYYNYDGSASVDIVVDNPIAQACMPYRPRPIPDGLYVQPTAIGNVELVRIKDLESDPAFPTAATGLVDEILPWGGTLALQMSFDPNIKTAVAYYRWSYRFDGDPDFTQLNALVRHRYKSLISVSPFKFQDNFHVLGPQKVGTTPNLYEIIPDLDPAPGGYGWEDVVDAWDRPFGYFDSTGNGYVPFTYTDAAVPARRSGLCSLLLEMFDAAGNFVPCGNDGHGGPFVFVLPDGTKPNLYTSTLSSNNVTPAGALSFRVRIDNNDTFAQISGAHADTVYANDCGLLSVDPVLHPNVSIDFAATHPNDYLTWNLDVARGFCGTAASASGSSSAPPFTLPAPSSTGNLTVSVATLLGPVGACLACPGGAAFAANLRCWASATDGYSRQSQYDRWVPTAFAILPI
jgi:hypothetical protein